MQIEKNRHLNILNCLMKNRDSFISSETLAVSSMSSVRSVKSDIAYLNTVLERENIAYIESKASRGYRLIKMDPEAFDRFEQTLQVHRLLYRNRSIEEMHRRLFILQHFLANENTKIDDMADALYLSRSSLTKDISWCTKFLASYHLKTVSVPGKGIHIEGKESDLRSAMVEVFCSQYHDIEQLYPVDEFTALFNTEAYPDVRHEMLKVIRESDLTISDIAAKKIATHLCLVPERLKNGYRVDFDKELQTELQSSYEYGIASQILMQPSVTRLFENNDAETAELARLLLISKDINLRNPAAEKHIDQVLLNKTHRVFNAFLNEYKNNTFFQSSLICEHEKDLISVIMRFILQNRYDHTDQYRMVTYMEPLENTDSPLAQEYARHLVLFLEYEFSERIRSADIRTLVRIFHQLIKQIPLEHRKMKLAAVSLEGLSVSEIMKDELISEFPDMIENIDVFNLYEMRRICFDDYDAVISSWDIAYYKYQIPLISYRGISRQEDRRKLFADLLIHSFSDRLAGELLQMMKIHKASDMDDYMTVIKSLARKYAKSEKHAEEILEKAVRRFSAVSYYNPDSGISMIFMDYSDTGKEIIDVLIPSQTIYWGAGLEIRYFMAVCFKEDRSLSDFRMLSQILQLMASDTEVMDNFTQNPEPVLKKIYRDILISSTL